MGEEYTGWEIDFQAQALAEKTVNMPLEALAQLCPLAEELIEQVLMLPSEPPRAAREMLGLETMEETRRFFDRVIFNVRQSPQDVLAQYLYQGQCARKAGAPPRDWIRVHRLAHLAILKLPHHFQFHSAISEDIRQTFFLADERNYQALRELHLQSDGTLPGRLKMLGAWLLEVRKVAASGLLRRAENEHHFTTLEGGIPPFLERRSARIPLTSQNLRPAEAVA